jgi:hypothetical protein
VNAIAARGATAANADVIGAASKQAKMTQGDTPL